MLLQAGKSQKILSILSRLYKNERIYAVYYADKKVFIIKTGRNRDYFARLSCLYKNCKNWSEQFHFFILQSKFLVSKKINIWPSSKFELDWANNSNDFDGNKTFYWSRSIQKRFLLPKVEVSCFQKYEKLT
jgi:hypothetical protein